MILQGDRSVRVRRQTIDLLRAGLAPRSGKPAGWVHEVLARGQTVPRSDVDHPDLVVALESLRLVVIREDRVEPLARIDVVGRLLVASDLRRLRRAGDFVVGPGPASFLLARHVRPDVRGRLLDLGSGSGIQGLLLGDRGTEVLGIDINPRAIGFARFNAGLNDRPRSRAELGDFLGEPPDRRFDGRFDTVVANPPFVLAPRHELTYRDRPLDGDEVGARTVEQVGRALARGGRGYVLCNWIDRADGWSRPVRDWVAGSGLDAAVLRVGTLEPDAYAAIWTRDVPTDQRGGAIAAWAAGLRAEGVERIHVGIVAVARPWRGRGDRFSLAEPLDTPSWRGLEALVAA
jgi:methylase of polypeptide subunit release factors